MFFFSFNFTAIYFIPVCIFTSLCCIILYKLGILYGTQQRHDYTNTYVDVANNIAYTMNVVSCDTVLTFSWMAINHSALMGPRLYKHYSVFCALDYLLTT